MGCSVTAKAAPDAQAIGEFLTNPVSRTLVYALLHRQPLTRRELEADPLRQHLLTLGLERRPKAGQRAKAPQLRSLLGKGVDCGMLVALRSRRENYYFLNSDLELRPDPIGDEPEDPKGPLRLSVKEDAGLAPGRADEAVALPEGSTLAPERAFPIPYLESNRHLLLWLSWLVVPRRRRILQLIARHGRVPRPKIRQELGFWEDRLVAREAVPAALLEVLNHEILFQFSQLALPEAGDGGERPYRWIQHPPSFWLTRSYEPLRALVMEGERKTGRSPRSVLAVAQEAHARLDARRRPAFLQRPFLELPPLLAEFGSTHHLTSLHPFRNALVPQRLIENTGKPLYVWAAQGDAGAVQAPAHFAEGAALVAGARRQALRRIRDMEAALVALARERIDAYLRVEEQRSKERLAALRLQSFGLGRSSIEAIASHELHREQLSGDRRAFEKFLKILAGSPPERPGEAAGTGAREGAGKSVSREPEKASGKG